MAAVVPGASTTVAAAGAPSQTAAVVVPGAATTTAPAAVVPVPAATTTTIPVAAATVPAVALPTSTTSTTPIAPIPGVSTTSSASRSHSSSVASLIQSGSGSNVNNAANGPGGGSSNSSLKVIIPIATIACVLVIIYILYRLYLLHKGRKEQTIPLPPPRTPAIFEQRRPQSVMMMYGQQPPPLSYNSNPGMSQSGTPRTRPVSYMYDAGQSNSSLTKAGFYNANGSGSGHSTPTATHDELSLERPFRGGARPHSIASFGSLNGSARGSSYGPVRSSPHGSLRGEVVLPAPLSPHAAAAGGSMHSYSPLTGRSSRYSMFNAPTMMGGDYTDIRPSSSAEMRPPSTAPYPDLPLLRPGSSYGEPMRQRPMSAMAAPGANFSHSLALPTIPRMADDWTERIDVAEVESNSTCTAHQHPNRAQTPPPPLPEKPRTPISPLSRTLSPLPMNSSEFGGRPTRSTSPLSPGGKTTPSSFSGHIPGAFPRSPTPTQQQRPRSVSPPEPLLNGAFVSTSESTESR